MARVVEFEHVTFEKVDERLPFAHMVARLTGRCNRHAWRGRDPATCQVVDCEFLLPTPSSTSGDVEPSCVSILSR